MATCKNLAPLSPVLACVILVIIFGFGWHAYRRCLAIVADLEHAQQSTVLFWCQIANAITMIPPLLVTILVFWLDGKRRSAAFPLILAWAAMLPASCSSHIYAATHGNYWDWLVKLDQISIAGSCSLAAWALSQSKSLTYILLCLASILGCLMFLGPLHLQNDVKWRSTMLAGMCLLYLSPMIWARRGYDPNLAKVAVVFIFGVLLGVDSRHSALGVISHPLFHLLFIPYAYYVAKSAIFFENELQQVTEAENSLDGSDGSSSTCSTIEDSCDLQETFENSLDKGMLSSEKILRWSQNVEGL